MNIYVILQGLALGFALIVAIGPQNTFVIKQGIKREHVFLAALTCSLIDVFLIGLGVIGMGGIFASHPLLTEIARWFGVCFLTCYGLLAFKAALHPDVLQDYAQKPAVKDWKKILFVLLGLGLLNPHAYLDGVVLIGSIAAQHGIYRYSFGFGAIIASFIWFFSIAYGARLLTPIFKKKIAWQILDIIVGIMMFIVAISLLLMK